MKLSIILSIILLLSFESLAQNAAHHHTEHLSSLVDHYLAAKAALNQDNLEAAREHIRSFKEEATQSSEMNRHPEHSDMHNKHHGAMVSAIAEAEKAENLSAFRRAFHSVTENLVKAIENQEFDEETLYLQYCPMALDGEGATWISATRQIANPYMGQKMSKCGVEKEVLSNDSK